MMLQEIKTIPCMKREIKMILGNVKSHKFELAILLSFYRVKQQTISPKKRDNGHAISVIE